VTVVADILDTAAGIAITADQTTLIVAESSGRRLTAFHIGPDGALFNRRIATEGLAGPPNGITVDADGGVWAAMPLAHQFQRIVDGGAVIDRIDIGDRSPSDGATIDDPGVRPGASITSKPRANVVVPLQHSIAGSITTSFSGAPIGPPLMK